MLSHVWAGLRRTLGGKGGNATPPTYLLFYSLSSISLCPLIKHVKTILSSLVRQAVEPLNAVTIKLKHNSESLRSLGSR